MNLIQGLPQYREVRSCLDLRDLPAGDAKMLLVAPGVGKKSSVAVG